MQMQICSLPINIYIKKSNLQKSMLNETSLNDVIGS
jgi:hypothetical protein